jgi:hypothetical protein
MLAVPSVSSIEKDQVSSMDTVAAFVNAEETFD